MSIKLDLINRKILNQLDINCRQSDAKIGKKTRLSKQVVNYRIKKLIEKQIIVSFFPHINISKLGFSAHKVYLQFKSLTKEKEKEMWDYLIKQEQITWIVNCSGKWDLIFGVVSKTIQEFNLVLSNFMNKYSGYVFNRVISVFNKATLHHRKWILNNQTQKYWGLGGEIENIKLDKLDLEILELLNKNARIQIVKIANKIGISSSLVIQRIKKLQKKRIIGGFRISLNREKLGLHYCKAFVYYQNKTTKKENQLLTYCYDIPNILGVSQSIGPWDLELEFEFKTYDEFHKTMKELKYQFPLIANFETIYIDQEYGNSFLPYKT